MSNIESGNISRVNRAWRFVATKGMALFPLRSDCERRTDGMLRAEKLAEEGYALIIVSNHFWKRDQEQLIKDVIFRDPVLGKKSVLSPIAIHQNPNMLKNPQKWLNVTLANLVTESTMNKLSEQAKKALVLKNRDGIYKNRPNGPMKLNDGSREFGEKTIIELKRGGIVIISPQGTEKEKLGAPDKPVVSTLILGAKRSGIEKIAILVVGIGDRDAPSYERKHIGGFKGLLHKYSIMIGNCFTLQEMMDDSRVGGKIRNIDNFIFEELRKVVPDNYK